MRKNQWQECKKRQKAEEKAEAAEAAARGEMLGGAGPDPLRGGLFDENGRPCFSQGDAGQQTLSLCAVSQCCHPAVSLKCSKGDSAVLFTLDCCL